MEDLFRSLTSLLSEPVWTGIGAIATIVSLLAMITKLALKLFRNPNFYRWIILISFLAMWVFYIDGFVAELGDEFSIFRVALIVVTTPGLALITLTPILAPLFWLESHLSKKSNEENR
ncbi:MAG: hypothetical protein LGR52_08025 [Candidatus Thiosymbion ectosymbiont of Robbea hypermnestra]|nr:hypothetical protein [Candidatus Thiosymbion ectosymbiont of Robbea hypermnestra]